MDETPKEEGIDKIAEAKAVAERIEKATKDLKEQLNRQQAIKAEEILAGRSLATDPGKVQTEDDKEIAAARKMLEGTGYDDELFPLK